MNALKMGLLVVLTLGAVGAMASGVVAAEGIDVKRSLRSPVGASVRPFPSALAPAAIAASQPPVAAEPAEAAPPSEPKPSEATKPVESARPVEAVKAAEPKPAAKPSEPKPPSPLSVAEGRLTLRASDTADVYVDGKKVGQSPVAGYRAKAGAHKVRFDCYDSSGNAQKGDVQNVLVPPDEDIEVEFQCLVE